MLVPVPIGGAFRLKYPSRLRTCHQSAEFVEVEYAWDTPLNISDWENTTEVYASHPHIPGVLWIDEFSQPSYDMCYLQILQQLQVCCCRLVCVLQCVCVCVCVCGTGRCDAGWRYGVGERRGRAMQDAALSLTPPELCDAVGIGNRAT